MGITLLFVNSIIKSAQVYFEDTVFGSQFRAKILVPATVLSVRLYVTNAPP